MIEVTHSKIIHLDIVLLIKLIRLSTIIFS